MKKKLSILLMIILVLSLVYGCGSKSDSNSGTNNDNTNPSLKWPAESMGDLPVVKGTITGVTHGDNNLFCTVTFKEMAAEDARDYVKQLKALNYLNGIEINDADIVSLTGFNEKGFGVNFAYECKTKEGVIIYSIPDKK